MSHDTQRSRDQPAPAHACQKMRIKSGLHLRLIKASQRNLPRAFCSSAGIAGHHVPGAMVPRQGQRQQTCHLSPGVIYTRPRGLYQPQVGGCALWRRCQPSKRAALPPSLGSAKLSCLRVRTNLDKVVDELRHLEPELEDEVAIDQGRLLRQDQPRRLQVRHVEAARRPTLVPTQHINTALSAVRGRHAPRQTPRSSGGEAGQGRAGQGRAGQGRAPVGDDGAIGPEAVLKQPVADKPAR